MEILFTKLFNKEVSRLNDKKLALIIEKIISEVKTAKYLSEIDNLKKLSGFKNAYRIRAGDYRIGIYFDHNMVIFSTVKHRKDIYKYFP